MPFTDTTYDEEIGRSDSVIVLERPIGTRLFRQKQWVIAGGLLLDCGLLTVSALPILSSHTHNSHSDMVVAVILLTLFCATLFRSYSAAALTAPILGSLRVFSAFVVSLSICWFSAIWMGNGIQPSHALAWAFAFAPILAIQRWIMARFGEGYLPDRPIREVRIVDPAAGEIAQCSVQSDGLPEGATYTPIRPDLSDPLMLDAFGTLLRKADRVQIACPDDRRDDWEFFLHFTSQGRLADAVHSAATGASIGRYRPLSTARYILKRGIDLAVTIPLLLLVGPLMIATAIAIKVDSPGPCLFVQNRLGRGNRLFPMYKFRSMRAENADRNGGESTSRNDRRVTRVGQFIRATSIDELPQLFNVLNGTMSLVGPRPHALGSRAEGHLFWEIDQRYWYRHMVLPGITGLAQVRGHRGTTEVTQHVVDRLVSDLEYVEQWSPWLDLRILFATFGVLIHENAY